MKHKKIHVLLVEDDEDDFVLLKSIFSEIKLATYEITWVKSFDEAKENISKKKYDICLIDYRLGEHTGIEIVQEARRANYLFPFILLTGQNDYEIDVAAMHAGVDDYLVKGSFEANLLERSIRYAIERKQSTSERDKLLESQKARKIAEEAEAQFRLLADSMPQIVWTALPDGKIDYYNQRWYDFSGFTPGVDDEKDWTPLLHPDEIESIQKAWNKSVITGKTYEVEQRLKDKKTAQYRWFLCRALPVRNQTGKIIKWFGTCTDISEQKKTEDKLRESDTRFRFMADNAPTKVWMADLNTKRYYFNKRWLRFTGRTVEEEVDKGWMDIIHPDDILQIRETYEQSFRNKLPFEMEYRLRRHDGNYRWILDIGAPLITPQKEFIGYIGSGIDITDRRELEERRNEFISIASHELKTPVTSIKAYTQVLHHGFLKDGNQKAASMLAKMDTQLNKLTYLISDLLDVTKIESGKLLLQKETFDINLLVDEVIEQIQLTAAKHKITKKGQSTEQIYADRDRTGQVLINFLTNAIKYSPNANSIIVSIDEKEKECIVSVKDFGVGISKEKQGYVFERFYRVSGPKESTFPGLGLGLYISSEIIKRQQGNIWVESTPGKSTTFFFSLPKKSK